MRADTFAGDDYEIHLRLRMNYAYQKKENEL